MPAVTASDGFRRIAPDVRLGPGVEIGAFANLYGCSIGEATSLGTFVEVQKGASVGARCRIESHAFLCEGVTLEDDVTIGQGVCFTNGLVPRSVTPEGRFVTDGDWTALLTHVGRGARIGANSSILCGLRIGAGAKVRAGAVVTRDVAPGETVAGVPARPEASTAARPEGD